MRPLVLLKFNLLFVVEFCGTVSAQRNKYDDQIKLCYSDLDLDKLEQCVLRFWNGLKPWMAKGIPELHIPPMETLRLGAVRLHQKGPLLRGIFAVSNVTVSGALDHQHTVFRVVPEAKLVRHVVTWPKVLVTGQYSVNGTVLLLTVDGSGTFAVNVTGAVMTVLGHRKRVFERVSEISRLDVDFQVRSIGIAIDGLVGDDEVGRTMVSVLNDHSQDVFRMVKPLAQRVIAKVLLKTLRNFGGMPSEVFEWGSNL